LDINKFYITSHRDDSESLLDFFLLINIWTWRNASY